MGRGPYMGRMMDEQTRNAAREAALIAQAQAAASDAGALRSELDQLTRDFHGLRLAHSRVGERLAARERQLYDFAKVAARAASRCCDPFAAQVLRDLAARALTVTLQAAA